MTVLDRYRVHGLSHNPFAFDVADPHEVFVPRGLAELPPRGSQVVVQLIGDRGAGKTTQLHAWRRDDPGPYVYVPPGPLGKRWQRPPVADLLYVDEVDRLPSLVRWNWFRQLAKAEATAVVGTHRDVSAAARRCGLAVITERLGAVDITTLRRVVDARLRVAGAGFAGAGPAGVFSISDDELREVHARSNGSLRVAERFLHELTAAKVSTC